MPHVVEVDQSIKIEQSGATVLAFSNGISHAILIPSKIKTAGVTVLQARGKSKQTAQLMLFAACLSLLLKDYLSLVSQIVIDVEYDGKDAEIKATLLRYIWKDAAWFEPERIVFRQVGKKPSMSKSEMIAP